MKSNALKKPEISRTQIEQLESMREAMDSMKKRYELLENAVKAGEQEIIYAIESGAGSPTGYDLQIRQIERRFPSWKAHYASLAGGDAAERVLAATPATIYKTLVVK